MTGFASAQCFEPGRARMKFRFSNQIRLRAESRRGTTQLVWLFQEKGISGYFNLIPRHAAMRIMSCFDADLRRWSSTFLRSFMVSISAMILTPHT